VQLHRGFRWLEVGPREDGEAQINRGGVERVDRLFQFHRERLVGVQLPGFVDQDLREIGIDPPVPLLVGHGERVAAHAAADAHVVELVGQGAQAGFDVAQALAKGELREGHRKELVPAGEGAHPLVAVVPLHTAGEGLVRNKAHELREDSASLVHHPLRCEVSQQNGCGQSRFQIVPVQVRSQHHAHQYVTATAEMLNGTLLG